MNADIIAFPSTGTCPAEWREWWRHERIRCGTNWRAIGETATAIMRRVAAELSS